MFKSFAHLGFICLFTLVGCGDNNKKSTDAGPDLEKFRGFNKLEINQQVVYQSGCVTKSEDGEIVHMMDRLELTMTNDTEADFSMKSVIFTDKCEIPLLETQIKGQGTFAKENRLFKVANPDFLMRPLHDEVTNYLNSEASCGFYDWETYELKDITNTSCVTGDMNADIYINTRNNGEAVTLYVCESNAPLNHKCDKFDLNKI